MLRRHDAVAGCCWTLLASLLDPHAPPGGCCSARAAGAELADPSVGCLLHAVADQRHHWMLLALLQADLGYYLALVAAAAVAGDEAAVRGRQSCQCSMKHAGVVHGVGVYMHHAVLDSAAAAAGSILGRGQGADGAGWGVAGKGGAGRGGAGRLEGVVVSVDR